MEKPFIGEGARGQSATTEAEQPAGGKTPRSAGKRLTRKTLNTPPPFAIRSRRWKREATAMHKVVSGGW